MKENVIYRMDAIEGMKKLKDESVDLIVTDPPFNIASKNRNTIQKGKLKSTAEVFGEWDAHHPFSYDVLIMQVIDEAWRVLKRGGSMYMFTAKQDCGYFIRKAVQRGFTYRNQIALVKKTAMVSIFKNSWRNAFDVCMFLTKGRQGAFNFPGHSEAVNVYYHPISDKYSEHPTEKPLKLITRFIEVSSNQGDLVLDPFMGSGTTAVAAKVLKRRFIGFERKQEYIAMAKARLKNEPGAARRGR